MLPYCHYCDSINDVKKFTKVAYRCLKCKKVFFIKSKSIDPYRPSPDLRGETKEEHMALMVKIPTGSTIPPCQAGIHNAICCAAEYIGVEEYEYKGEKKSNEKVVVLIEVDKRIEEEGDFKGKRFLLSNKYTFSLGDKANLRKDLESWRGTSFTPEEIKTYTEEGFDLEKLIGVKCTINVMHKETKNGNKIATITSIMPAQESNEMEIELTDIPKWIKDIQKEKGLANFDEGVE